ncbi:hypothetical protein [Nocardia spumae]|uniref:hypothetical protein n=1 Tax=Nocardia spumae TaxID=2887190 RepID=UPI001D14C494|nr:hypothetical protein [Nocardia spumae]
MGDYVTELDERGDAADTGIRTSIAVHGSFRVTYAEHIDRVCVEVAPNKSSAFAQLSMQLTLEQAAGLRDMLDAAMSDYLAAHVVSPLAIEVGGR